MNLPCALLCCGLIVLPAHGALAQEAAFPQLQLSQRIEAPWIQRDVAVTPQHGIALRSSPEIGPSLVRRLVLAKGRQLIGKPYEFGANRDDAVDCSALMQQMFRRAGIRIPRTTREQVRIGRRIELEQVRPGDLLFYRFGPSGMHVAIYLDDGEVLHASSSRRKVMRSRLNDYWHDRFVMARRRL